MQLFQEQGVDTVFVVHFTSDFAKLSPAAFIDTFIRGLNIQHVTAGFDFSFGAFGKGTMEEMRALSNGDYGVTIVEKKKDDIEKISSTRIRKLLQEGDMEAARMLLGRPFEIAGIVIHGDKRGRTIGFPTANVQALEALIFQQAVSMLSVYLYKIIGMMAYVMWATNQHLKTQMISNYPLRSIY